MTCIILASFQLQLQNDSSPLISNYLGVFHTDFLIAAKASRDPVTVTHKMGGTHSLYALYGHSLTSMWVFPKIGVGPQNGWFIMGNPIKMDDLGGPPLFLVQHPCLPANQIIFSIKIHLQRLTSCMFCQLEETCHLLPGRCQPKKMFEAGQFFW